MCHTDGEVTLWAVHVAVVAVARRSERLSLTPRLGELEVVLNDPQIADVQPQLAEVCASRVHIVDVLVGTRRGRAAVEELRLVLVEDGIVLLRLHRNIFPRRGAVHLVAVDAHGPRAHLQHVLPIRILSIHALHIHARLRPATSTADTVRNAGAAANDAANAATRRRSTLDLLHLWPVIHAAHVRIIVQDATPLVARAIAL